LIKFLMNLFSVLASCQQRISSNFVMVAILINKQTY